jgi:rhodanese-related sulfurtransferase
VADAIEHVSATEAISLSKGTSVLLDVREQDEWDAGHAPQAQSLPMSQLTERLSELPVDTDILVICHSGGRSQRVTRALVDAGYPAIDVSGGMLAWAAAGGEVVEGPARR